MRKKKKKKKKKKKDERESFLESMRERRRITFGRKKEREREEKRWHRGSSLRYINRLRWRARCNCGRRMRLAAAHARANWVGSEEISELQRNYVEV